MIRKDDLERNKSYLVQALQLDFGSFPTELHSKVVTSTNLQPLQTFFQMTNEM